MPLCRRVETIAGNDEEADEIAVGGFTEESASSVECPKLAEAFLTLECKLEKEITLGTDEEHAVLIGKVLHIAAEEAFAKGMDEKYGEDGFMFNIHSPKDFQTGEGVKTGVSVCKIVKVYGDSE